MTDAEHLISWKKDPRIFVRRVIGATPDPWQDEVLAAFPENQRIALSACKGPGKSTLMSWLAWNFLVTRPHPKIIATSITGQNLRDGLWGEMARWQANSRLLKELFAWTAEKIFLKESPSTWYMAARAWAKDADAGAQANALAGIHAEYLLFLLDEVAEYPEGVVAAAEAALSTGKDLKMVVAGNPTTVDGPLYRIATKDRDKWFFRRISGDPDDPMRAPRVKIDWAQQQAEIWGKESNFYRVNVLGEFPLAGSDKLIDANVANKASERNILEKEFKEEPRILGLDVARFGDDRSVLFPRQGKAAFRPTVWRELSLMDLVGRVMDYAQKWKPHVIFCDQTGMGSGVVDRLRELGTPVVGVDFGSRALRRGYKNRRAEMWGVMREWLRDGGAIPRDSDLLRELTAPSYHFDSTGAMLLESKSDLKSKGLPSPDLADALALTFAAPVFTPELASSGTSGYNPSSSSWDYNPLGLGS